MMMMRLRLNFISEHYQDSYKRDYLHGKNGILDQDNTKDDKFTFAFIQFAFLLLSFVSW